MTGTQDSSVLFALDELREQERARANKESEKVREQAAVARRQAEEAVRRRLKAKQDAEELTQLRSLVREEAASRIELEQEIQTLKSATRTFKPSPPSPTYVATVHAGSSHHFLWAAALLFSCLSVYVVTYSPEVSSPPIVEPTPAVVASNDCQPTGREAETRSEGGVDTKPAEKTVESSVTKPPLGPRRPRNKGGKGIKEGPKPIDLDSCDGPLCFLPE